MEENVSRLASFFESTLGEAADELVVECGVIRWVRKLTGRRLVQILVLTCWDDPDATWEKMAENALRWFGLEISAEALTKKADFARIRRALVVVAELRTAILRVALMVLKLPLFSRSPLRDQERLFRLNPIFLPQIFWFIRVLRTSKKLSTRGV